MNGTLDENVCMNKISEIDFVPFDLETTGLDVDEDRIVSFGVSVFEAGAMKTSGQRVVNPGIPIPTESSRVHGIYTHDVEKKEPFSAIIDRVTGKFDTCSLIVGYNCLRFDAPLLDQEMKRAGRDWRMDRAKVLDLKVFVDWHHRGERPRTQEAMAEFYGLKIEGMVHSAAYDTQLTGRLLLAMVAKGTIPDDVEEALRLQEVYREKVEGEFDRFSYWIYADRETGAWRLWASKNCGKLLSEVPKSSLSYLLNNIPDMPGAVRELMSMAVSGDMQMGIQKPMVEEQKVEDDTSWGGW